MRIDDPELVRREHENERALAVRNLVFRDLARATDPDGVVVGAVAEAMPRCVQRELLGTAQAAFVAEKRA